MQYWESNPGSQALAKPNFKTEVINSGINGDNYKKIRQGSNHGGQCLTRRII